MWAAVIPDQRAEREEDVSGLKLEDTVCIPWERWPDSLVLTVVGIRPDAISSTDVLSKVGDNPSSLHPPDHGVTSTTASHTSSLLLLPSTVGRHPVFILTTLHIFILLRIVIGVVNRLWIRMAVAEIETKPVLFQFLPGV